VKTHSINYDSLFDDDDHQEPDIYTFQKQRKKLTAEIPRSQQQVEETSKILKLKIAFEKQRTRNLKLEKSILKASKKRNKSHIQSNQKESSNTLPPKNSSENTIEDDNVSSGKF
jgi:hypothetical protein